MRILAIDLETYSEIDLTKAGAYKYAENSEILLFGYAFDDEPVRVVDMANGEALPPEVRSAIFDSSVLKTAFNAPFERAVLSCYFNAAVGPDDWYCTMVQAYTLGISGGLDTVSKVLRLSEDKAKMSVGKQLIQYFCKPCKPTKTNGGRTRNRSGDAPEKWALFKEYCGRDVEAEREIRKRMQRFWPTEFERRLWCLDQRINDRGVRIDQTLVDNAIGTDARFKAEIMAEAQALTGVDNPNSRDQLLDWFEEQAGFRPEKFDKEARKELLKDTRSAEVRRLLELKQLLSKTSVRKYETMQRACCCDGRIHGALQFHGAARTGRWAGRLVQLHNLPKNKMDDLDFARQALARGDYDLLVMFYDDIPDVLSQLIRTAFVAEEGSRYIVADFSAIEARVTAWLADEKWRLDVFAGDGKIYEASAAQMFHVPVKTIDKHSPLRQKGKVAELACGYGGGVGALIAMGALDGGLAEEELPAIIDKWRAASPRIVRMWHDVEKCAKRAIREKTRVAYKHGVQFSYEAGLLFIKLPSGRRIAYVRPRLEREAKFNRITITYEGPSQAPKGKGGGKWCRLHTWGGKLVENCLGEGTLVLTERGLVPIEHVRATDKVFDGLQWVNHKGIICKGFREVIKVNGLYMTPEHKILTTKGWVKSGNANRFSWRSVSLSDSFATGEKYETRKTPMAVPMHLWQESNSSRARSKKEKISNKVMRMHAEKIDFRGDNEAWNVKASGMGGMAFHETALREFTPQSLQKLWGSRDSGMSDMELKFRSFLARHGTNLQNRLGNRQNRQQQRIQSGKLPMDNPQKQCEKSEIKQNNRYATRKNACVRVSRKNRNRTINYSVQNIAHMADRVIVHKARFQKQVYDILNCGPRHRFVVWDAEGQKFRIVSNCVQAIARDCLAVSMVRLDEAGYPIVMHVHDEVICEMPDGVGSVDEACEIMGRPIEWAPGLLLRAEGYETKYYKKD